MKTGKGLETLIKAITHRVKESIGTTEAPLITRARHRQELTTCQQSLNTFLNSGIEPLELRAEDLRQAAEAIGRITGRIDVEDILDEIFNAFCIGK